MRLPLVLALLAATGLAAQTPAPAGPAIKWRGAVWASGAASDRQAEDGSLFLRSADAGEGQLALDGLQLGADVTLADGWAMKFTILTGQTAKILNAGTPGETGSLAWPEAMISWTGGQETFKFGRMYTAMGMEVLDHTQDLTASRGLLFTYAVPIAQVGLNWHHAFSGSWSSDVWVYNGEDQVQDNNRGKTAGLGLTYNHGGAADKFVNLMAFSGAEQAPNGYQKAEGNKRNRVSLSGQWVWGATTLQWEGEHATETIQPNGQLERKASWSGYGAIGKYQFNDAWSVFARAEVLKDDTGDRLGLDRSVQFLIGQALPGADLQATSFALGAERRWHATFTRIEVRRDSLNKDVTQSDGKPFRDATSLTWSVGTSF